MKLTNLQPGAVRPDEGVVERLRRDVATCAVRRDVFVQPEANLATRDWILERLTALGYGVELQGEYDNVVALPARTTGAVRLVCAHYDSVSTTPGADDNASAVAVMLEVARRLQGTKVGFVGFNAEEHRLAGSFDFVDNYLPTAPFEVEVAHVLEMVGYTNDEPGSQTSPIPLPGMRDVGDFIAVIADQGSAEHLDHVLSQARTLGVSPPVTTLRLPPGAGEVMPDAFRSDHAPFWLGGLPALMWTDTSEFRNPNYHQPSDRPETLDYEFMARVAALVERCVERLQDRLFAAVRSGNLSAVREVAFRKVGTGTLPPRLALLESRNHDGQTAEDLARELGHEDIQSFLRSERVRMEYFE